MKRLLFLLPLLALPSCEPPRQSAAAEPAAPVVPTVPVAAPAELVRSVVRINATRQSWNDTQPWEKNPPNQRRALGALVGANLVLTTSELVGDATYLEFESTDGTRLIPAKVLAVDYEANLALGHREDERSYLVAAQMLHALGVSRIDLLSNNPDKARQLHRFGITVSERVPTGVHLSAANARYLATKAASGAHTLDLPLSAG